MSAVAVGGERADDGSRADDARRDRLPARLGAAGASLGLLAGLLELAAGPSMRSWVGDKQDTTRLGVTTTVLALVALVATGQLRRPNAGRRIAIVLALVLPAFVGFTTVGRLWYVPGPLLLVAGALVLTATRPREFSMVATERHWRVALLALCGLYYVFLGATALGVAGTAGIVGGLLIWGVASTAPRSASGAYALLLVGALPFAAATWWSVVTPLVALTAVVAGRGVIRTRPRPRARRWSR